MELATVREQFEKVRKRTSSADRELNIFSQEMRKAEKLDLGELRKKVPEFIRKEIVKKKITTEFAPEYYGKGNFPYWLALKKRNTDRQLISSERACLYVSDNYPNLRRFKEGLTKEEAREKISPKLFQILPNENEYFGLIFRSCVEMKSHPDGWYNICFGGQRGSILPSDLWGMTRWNMEDSARTSRIISYSDAWRPVYKIGKFFEEKEMEEVLNERPQGEQDRLLRQLMVESVFEMQPPKEKEIKSALCEVEGVTDTNGIFLDWAMAEELEHVFPKGVSAVYSDAKGSGLFSKFEVGILTRAAQVIDPVLAGTYQGFRIPLCYWK